jgi:hypothetical protein
MSDSNTFTNFTSSYMEQISSIETSDIWEVIDTKSSQLFSFVQEVFDLTDLEEITPRFSTLTADELDIITKMEEVARFSLQSLIF